ncbi:hypothetical protein [Dermacoccus nishinomiyaensis]|uniref:hypothetical protein n=1 Tax=Dermacoccus nishinomiyaensis TaxID=1274 RepID=UPI00248EC993|nr:hypothetical protein [Dermacoccus nishinomiyaensis]
MRSMNELGNDLYTGKTSFPFVGKRRTWFIIAAILVIGAALVPLFRPIQFSIEFTGGSQFTVSGLSSPDQTVATDAVREVGEQTEVRVEDELEREADGGAGQDERREDRRAHEVATAQLTIEQQREPEADHHRQPDRRDGEDGGVAQHLVRVGVVQPRRVVLQTDVVERRRRQRPVRERQPDVVDQRSVGEHGQQREVGQQQRCRRQPFTDGPAAAWRRGAEGRGRVRLRRERGGVFEHAQRLSWQGVLEMNNRCWSCVHLRVIRDARRAGTPRPLRPARTALAGARHAGFNEGQRGPLRLPSSGTHTRLAAGRSTKG